MKRLVSGAHREAGLFQPLAEDKHSQASRSVAYAQSPDIHRSRDGLECPTCPNLRKEIKDVTNQDFSIQLIFRGFDRVKQLIKVSLEEHYDLPKASSAKG